MWKTLHKEDETPLDMGEFWNVYDVIEEEYFTSGAIDKQDLLYGAIGGMVDALWDKNSEFMTPEIYERFDEVLNGRFEWIGAVVEKVPLGILVERIIKWSPAKKYDVRSGDIIVKANGILLAELDLYDAVGQIKWPAGTEVILTILRAWEVEEIDISVIREEIEIPSIEEEYFEKDNIAYIAINQYGETTAFEFKKALNNVKKSWSQGLIIDVRDNWGGYLQSAVEILSEFIPSRELLVTTRYQDSAFNQEYTSFNNGDIYDDKVVVLINRNSASASEITAWALREYGRALIVWEKSYGKWSVQQPFEMYDGSLLKLTVAKWFTPKGRNIDEDGIEPDIEILFEDEDYENEYDRQLEEAKKILQLYQEKNTIWLTVESYEEIQEEESVKENLEDEFEKQ